MARWTKTTAEQQHVARISTEMPIGGLVRIKLADGRSIEGVLRRMHGGNNAGQGGWQYYGECEIETEDRSRWVIDYLDIEAVASAWTEENVMKYEDLGLISVRR